MAATRRARDFLREHQDLLGVKEDELRLSDAGVLSLRRGRLTVLHFEPHPHGIPVIGGRVSLVVNRGNLIAVHLVGTTPVSVSPQPTIDSGEAWRRSLAAAQLAEADVRGGASPKLGFWSEPSGHRLVWETTVVHRRHPQRLRVRLDARTGVVIDVTDETVSACPDAPPAGLDKRVLGGVKPHGDGDEERQELLPNGLVETSSVGADGFFAPPGPTYDGTLSGPHFSIECQGCENPTPTAPSGADGDVDFGTGGEDQVGNGTSTPADRATWFHAEMARRHASRWVDFPFLDQWVPLRTNIPQACNAYWDGSSLNFFQSSHRCGNTGENRDVIGHEWGHGLDDNDGIPTPGLAIDAATGEGVADAIALLRSRDPCIGESFHRDDAAFPSDTCDGVRDLDELSSGHQLGMPATLATDNVGDKCPPSGHYRGPLGRQGHCEGQIFGQALWNLVQTFRTGASHPDGTPLPPGNPALAEDDAWELLEELFYLSRPLMASYAPSHLQAIGMGAYEAFLLVDDEGDGLATGTPHAAAINEAFAHHGITELDLVADAPALPRPASPAVTLTAVPDAASGLLALRVDWTDTGAAAYEVLRSDEPTDAFLPVAPPVDPGVGSLVDRGVLAGRSYRYRVVALDADGVRSADAVAVAGSAGPLVRIADLRIDDTALGNGNAVLEAGETASVFVDLVNRGSGPASNAFASLAIDEATVVVLDPGPIAYGTIAAGATVPAPAPFQVLADAGAPRWVTVTVSSQSDEGCLDAVHVLELGVAWLEKLEHRTDDTAGGDGDGQWDPGESVVLTIDVEDQGLLDAPDVDGTLRFRGPPVMGVTLVDDTADWGTIASRAGAFPTLPPGFTLLADPGLGPRTKVPLTLDLRIDGVAHRSFDFNLTVGGFPPGQREWGYDVPGVGSIDAITPLVLHLTDDDADGAITTCDTPDIVAWAFNGAEPRSIVAISGDSGDLHWEFVGPETNTRPFAGLAGGDINGDGLPETVLVDVDAHVHAFSADGELLWTSANPAQADQASASASLAHVSPQVWDLDGDGDIEVVAGLTVLRGVDGSLVWESREANRGHSLVGDFDLDGTMEILSNRVAYRYDGTPYPFALPGPYVGNAPQTTLVQFDDDPEPEIVVSATLAHEHTGERIWTLNLPGEAPVGAQCVFDFDRDGYDELVVSNRSALHLVEEDGSIAWSTPVDDGSGGSGCSVFDFDGDERPEIVYRDEVNLMILDATDAEILWSTPMRHGTAFEYPVVADVDADGSAEIVVLGQNEEAGNLHVYGNDAWLPALQVWNQEDYRSTLVTELGDVVSDPFPSWLARAGFRAQALGQDFTCLCNSPTLAVSSSVPDCGELLHCFSAPVEAGQGPYELTWDFGDGSDPVVSSAPCHLYPAPGDYAVRVSVKDVNGCTDETGMLARVRDELLVSFESPPDCPGDACLIADVDGGQAPYEHAWDLGVGGEAIPGDELCQAWEAGEHVVTLLSRDANGCLAEHSLTFTVADPSSLPEVSPPGSSTPLRVRRSGADLQLTWEVTVLDSGVYQGDIASLPLVGYTHEATMACRDIDGDVLLPLPDGNVYFLVATAACELTRIEGSYGRDSEGRARPSAGELGRMSCP